MTAEEVERVVRKVCAEERQNALELLAKLLAAGDRAEAFNMICRLLEKQPVESVSFCNWCPVPEKPSAAHHPGGHPRHKTLKAHEYAAAMREAGWTVLYSPRVGRPYYQWVQPNGVILENHRSDEPEVPPLHALKVASVAGLFSLSATPEGGEDKQ